MKKRKYEWEAAFLDAISRLDCENCPTKVAAARALIDARVQELLIMKGHDKERSALIDALFALFCVEQYYRNRLSSEARLRTAS